MEEKKRSKEEKEATTVFDIENQRKNNVAMELETALPHPHLIRSVVPSSSAASSTTIAVGRRMAVETSTTSPPPSSSAPRKPGNVCPLRSDLDEPSSEQTLVERHGIRYEGWLSKLNVSETLGMSRPFVAEYRHPVDSPARLKMRLKLFWSRSVVHVPNIN